MLKFETDEGVVEVYDGPGETLPRTVVDVQDDEFVKEDEDA